MGRKERRRKVKERLGKLVIEFWKNSNQGGRKFWGSIGGRPVVKETKGGKESLDQKNLELDQGNLP